MDGTKAGVAGKVFGGILVAIGIVVLAWGIGAPLYDVFRSGDWQPVPGRLVLVNLAASPDRKAGDTYRVEAYYRYTFAGQTHTGSRVGVMAGGSDNIGDWHQRTYYRLKAAQDRDVSVTVWVNPADPAEAVLDREMRWGMLAFRSVFGLIPLGMGAAVLWLYRRKPKGVPSRQRIGDRSARAVVAAWWFAGLWGLLLIPALTNLPELIDEHDPFVGLVLLMVLVFPGLLIMAMVQTARRRRFGRVTLVLEPSVWTIGQPAGGWIDVRLPFEPGRTAHATLSCMHHYVNLSAGSDDTPHVSETRWEELRIAPMEPGPLGSRVRFDFRLPADVPATENYSNGQFEWVLHVRADLPGPDLDSRFVVPVEKAAATTAAAGSPLSSAVETPAGEDVALPPSIVRIHPIPSGYEFHYPWFRGLHSALSAMLVGVAFAWVGVWLLDGGTSLAIAAAIAGLGVLAVATGIYQVGNSLTVQVTEAGINRRRNVLGLAFSSKVPAYDMVKLDKRLRGEKGISLPGAGYAIELMTRSGRRITVGEGLPNAGAADQVMSMMREVMRWPVV